MFLNAYIYFYHLEKFCILPDYPESISDNMRSEFTATNALARTAPVYSYKNSGPRSVVVGFQLHRDLMNDINRDISNLKDNVVDFSGKDYIDVLIKYLQAAALPRYNEYSSGAKAVIPPMVAVRFGNSVFIKGVITSGIQCTWKKPILIDDKYACVDIQFTIDEVEPYDADYVAEMGSFRGITRTFKTGVFNDTSDSIAANYVSKTASAAEKSKVGSIKFTNKIDAKQHVADTSTTKGFVPPTTGVDRRSW